MISGLATCTPTVVVGWSHKYREVLDDFGLVEFGMDSTELESPQNIVNKVLDARGRKEEIARQIAARLPDVQERSRRNFAAIASVVRA
jgi:polysaccharide pyruvyl transferase WcaK-like protein